MKTYRITIQVTTDVIAPDEKSAVSQAVDRVREAVGDNPLETPGTPERPMWITGIAREINASATAVQYMIYPRTTIDVP